MNIIKNWSLGKKLFYLLCMFAFKKVMQLENTLVHIIALVEKIWL